MDPPYSNQISAYKSSTHPFKTTDPIESDVCMTEMSNLTAQQLNKPSDIESLSCPRVRRGVKEVD